MRLQRLLARIEDLRGEAGRLSEDLNDVAQRGLEVGWPRFDLVWGEWICQRQIDEKGDLLVLARPINGRMQRGSGLFGRESANCLLVGEIEVRPDCR